MKGREKRGHKKPQSRQTIDAHFYVVTHNRGSDLQSRGETDRNVSGGGRGSR